MSTLKTTPLKINFFLPLFGHDFKVSVELPDLSVESSPEKKSKIYQILAHRKFFPRFPQPRLMSKSRRQSFKKSGA